MHSDSSCLLGNTAILGGLLLLLENVH